MDDHIYLIEHFSRCLISIYIPTGKARIETYLPWKYSEREIGMLPLNQDILIYSLGMDHFLVYERLKHRIRTIRLQEIRADEVGLYYSNVLIDKDDFILLPFKGKTIRGYGKYGELKSKDNKWCSFIDKKCNYGENLPGNIRMSSACIVKGQLFFSLVYKKQNYLCRYEWNKTEHLCTVIFCSEDIPIRGIYAYKNQILFRRIFPDKTEIVLIDFNSNEEKTILIDHPTTFEEDIYGNIHHLYVALEDGIFLIKENNLKKLQKIYNFEKHDIYIINGMLFNEQKCEILIPDETQINKYSIEKIAIKIKNSSFYQEGYGKLFSSKCICEGKNRLNHLVSYLTEFPLITIEKKYMKSNFFGELIWKTIQ